MGSVAGEVWERYMGRESQYPMNPTVFGVVARFSQVPQTFTELPVDLGVSREEERGSRNNICNDDGAGDRQWGWGQVSLMLSPI